MRELSTTERFMMIMTTESNRDQFKIINTSTLPDWEQTGDNWEPVYKIRYSGSAGGPNRWAL